MNSEPGVDRLDWDRLAALFEQAADLPLPERRAFLAGAADGDTALLADLESLVNCSSQATSFFERLAGAASEAAAAAREGRTPAAANEPDESASRRDDSHGEWFAGRYRIESLLGRGGMGVVYRAFDRRLQRSIALKLLPPQLIANDEASRRFLIEARAAAALDHPNVCTVHEVGETEEGQLYLAMACYDGETLKQKLTRGPLPIEQALDYAMQVARGLAAAHDRGIIHRDVKPGNLMVTRQGLVKLLDFGLARLPDTAETRPSQAPGTTAYMSPEQVRGERLDHRTDLWSLGVVLYEMVTGVRPFRGESDAALLHAVLQEDAVPAKDLRPELPRDMQTLLERLLERDRNARLADAHELVGTLQGTGRKPRYSRLLGSDALEPLDQTKVLIADVEQRIRAESFSGRKRSTERPHLTEASPGSGLRLAPRGLWVATLAAAVLGAGWIALRAARPAARLELDANAIVVAPFRVGGTDPSVAHLREGMVDLLATRLTGEVGPRALDPRTTLSAWRSLAGDTDRDLPVDSAILVARGLGAGHLLLAEVVGAPERLSFSALLIDATTGRPGPRAFTTGPVDSLPALVDQLAAALLSVRAGEFDDRLDQLTSASLPATLAYLEAQALARRGRWERAVQHYEEALRLDSTFALAGIGLLNAAGWYPTPANTGDRGLRLAWAARDRLAERDRAYLHALAGPSYPDATTAAARVAEWERVAGLTPDRADVWHQLADILMHWGLVIEAPDALPRAIAGFERALALDSSFASPLVHLVDLPLYLGDLATAQHYLPLLREVDPAGLWSVVLYWAVAAASGDSAAVQAFRERLDALEITELRGMPTEAAMAAAGFADAERALRLALQRAGTSQERRSELARLQLLALSRGRSAESLQLANEMERVRPDRPGYLQMRVLDALFGDGDTVAANRAAAELAVMTQPAAGVAADLWFGVTRFDDEAEASGLIPRCVLEQWRLWRGDTSTAAEAVALMAAPPDSADTEQSRLHRMTCVHILDALLAHIEGSPKAGDRIDALETWLRAGPALSQTWLYVGNVTASRLLEARGEYERALRAIRRRFLPVESPYYVPTLRVEGNLAARTGDRDGAIAAYRRYLAFRADAEPALQPLVEEVRAALARLVPE